MRRSHLLFGGLMAASTAFLLPRTAAAPVNSPAIATRLAPNFVVIVGEAQGWSSGSFAMDDRVPNSRSDFFRTPNLEKLAQSGMRFSDAYAASPRCTPSRAALFTGKSPAQLHMTFVNEGRTGNLDMAGAQVLPPAALTELPTNEITLAELLKPAGYASAHFGKWHVGRANPARHGYDENDGPNNNNGPENTNPNPKEAFALTRRGLSFMAREVAAQRPFYLHLSHYASGHEQDALPATFAAWKARFPGADQRFLGQAASIEDMDTTIGQVLDEIKALGIENNTYVIYTSDHGAQGRNANAPLRAGKGTIWEGGVRVPFIVRGPGIKAGSFSHVRIGGEDLLPTIADLAGVKTWPASVEGGTLKPVLNGADAAQIQRPRPDFVVHFPHYDADSVGPASAIYAGNYKLVRTYNDGARRLFDIETDGGENRDLAQQQAAKTAELDARLSKYLQEIGAQMPTPNPNYDSTKPPPANRRGGRNRGENGDARRNAVR